MTFTSVIHAKQHRRDYVISLPFENITNQMNDTQNAARNLVSGTRNKTIRNWKNDHFTRIVTKHYSVVSCITDNTTYFTYQNTNRSSISHKSNYRTTWLRRYRFRNSERKVLAVAVCMCLNTRSMSTSAYVTDVSYFFIPIIFPITVYDFRFLYDSLRIVCPFKWPSCLRRRSATDSLLGLRVRTSPEARMSVSCEYCVFVK
jgi:hypothetical protein